VTAAVAGAFSGRSSPLVSAYRHRAFLEPYGSARLLEPEDLA